ncbi:unnamed protein product [Cuscuta campestris]|uniref:Reverse transcriptase domain-containing protein n=1 Tax=Cuscuta campestris TaxID=132261 RepID=A0A484LJ83_9ASTE|nr:unnamed protein product [Cuscuta campestris]
MDPNSSPGPDGFNINFFKQCWDIFKDDLTSACQEVFLGIPLPKAASSSNICMLPKTDNAMRLNDFRPVCLSTLASKIASKCIVNRLGKLLHLIISEEQGAYVPGREIMDQILITKELVHHINRKAHGGNLIVKLDIAKAFDKLKWSYLMDILKAFGFSPQFIRMANIIDSPVWKRIFSIDESTIDTCSVSDDGMMHWKLDPSGSFTFKSAYEFCRAGSTPRASFKYLWESPQNPKICIFTWKLFQHCIPSPENLQKLGFLIPSMCPFCQRGSYTAKHSLIDCHMIKGVWHHFSACVGILHQDSSSINQHFMNWWLRGNNNIYGFLRKHLPGIISWNIWKALNSLLYEDMNSFNPSKLIDSISRYTRNWLQMKLPKQLRVFDAWLIGTNLLPKFQSNPSIRLVKWLAPPKGRLKLNVDASFTHNAKQGAAILRDDQGRFVGAASFQVTGESPYQAEVDAAIKGITWALKFNKLLVKAAALERTQEQSNEESMDGMTAQNARYVGNTINLDEFPVLTKQNIEEDIHIPTENMEVVVHTPTEIEKEDTTGTPTLIDEDTTKENTTPNNSDVNPANIGPILHSFEHEGQLYEIRSHIEEGQTSNHNDENHTTHEFQEVQNRRSKKKQAMPRTIKIRSYDLNLEVGTMSEITRYWPSRKSTTMEKIVTTKTYSGPFFILIRASSLPTAHRPMIRASSLPTSYIFVLRCSDMSLFFNFQWHFDHRHLQTSSKE